MMRCAAAIGRTASQSPPDGDRFYFPVTRPARAGRTDILIDEAWWPDVHDRPIVGIESGVEDGAFLLHGVYRQGGDWFVEGLGEFFLWNIIPTPTRKMGDMEFGPVEDGEIRIEIVDIYVATPRSAMPGPGVYGVVLSTLVNWEPGPYMIVLRPGRKGRVSADGRGIRGKRAVQYEEKGVSCAMTSERVSNSQEGAGKGERVLPEETNRIVATERDSAGDVDVRAGGQGQIRLAVDRREAPCSPIDLTELLGAPGGSGIEGAGRAGHIIQRNHAIDTDVDAGPFDAGDTDLDRIEYFVDRFLVAPVIGASPLQPDRIEPGSQIESGGGLEESVAEERRVFGIIVDPLVKTRGDFQHEIGRCVHRRLQQADGSTKADVDRSEDRSIGEAHQAGHRQRGDRQLPVEFHTVYEPVTECQPERHGRETGTVRIEPSEISVDCVEVISRDGASIDNDRSRARRKNDRVAGAQPEGSDQAQNDRKEEGSGRTHGTPASEEKEEREGRDGSLGQKPVSMP